MTIQANFKNVKMSDGFTVLPGGTYHLTVKETKETTSKNGNDMVVIKFDAENEEAAGQITHRMVITEKSLPIVKKFLHCINQPCEAENTLINPADWIGATLDADVYVDKYTRDDGSEGESNKIKIFTKTMNDFPARAQDENDIPF